MSPRRPRSNPLALAILACLREKPMHPYEMATTMRERAKHESIRLNYGSLYSVVEALERDGLIEAQETVREGRRPERTIYRLTEPGAEEFADWLADLLRTPAKEYPQFEAGLSLLGGLPPDEAAALLEERSERLEAALAEQRATLAGALADGLPRLLLVELEYAIAMRDAELAYTRALAREIASGALEGVELWRTLHAPEPQTP
jgi:DNA-binding PadR family transcriptional regulator